MFNQNEQIAVLLMAYGSPDDASKVGEYFTHIRKGVRPSEEFIKRIEERYVAVGGKTPLLNITRQQQEELQKILDQKHGEGKYCVFIGMKHWYPYIKDTLKEIEKKGIKKVIALALAPHYSKMSIGGYQRFIDEEKNELSVILIESWHTNKGYLDTIVLHMKEVLSSTLFTQSPHIIFTAHSLPEKIRTWDDPYEGQLKVTATLIAEKFPHHEWSFAYQSMGQTSEPWIGPHLLEALREKRDRGVTDVLIVPVGFVTDNLEILYDIDMEAKNIANDLGIHLERTKMCNTHSMFIEGIAQEITDATVM